MALDLDNAYRAIEAAQLKVAAAIGRARVSSAKGETLAQLTLALRAVETAFDRVKRADESESS